MPTLFRTQFPTRDIRDIGLQGGSPAAFASLSGDISKETPNLSQSRAFGAAIMDLMKRAQGVGTAPIQEQGLRAREEQAKRSAYSAPELVGASPGLQTQARQAGVRALEPTISGASETQRTFAEQIRGFGEAIDVAREFGRQIQQEESQRKSDAAGIIDFTIKMGGSAGLQALLKEKPDIFKMAGFDIKTAESFIPIIKSREDEEGKIRKLEEQKLIAEINKIRSVGSIPGQELTPYRAERVGRILTSVEELKNRANNTTVGLGGFLARFPATPARNFKADLETLKANISFSELQAMREASKTGGALGQVAVRELELLESTLGALDQGQSPENFKKNLDKISESLQRWNQANTETQSKPAPVKPIDQETIRVKRKSDGRKGRIPKNEFDSKLYEKL